ncbi:MULTISPECIES: helix-turn-helix domain-containing protein [Mycolicibacter]|uniref:Helix-turn-helix transcriptional regulator n=2 Tax=Mycolicibacter TaxID=1073531 RepID=A0ABU5XMF9_9MYCO|nr:MULTISPECIES: helix-turn-helix transcriptional regulator [unclassified Mycolicibacter]MEB3023460.1 helix-turn-helix transcriptional regulator [Mycolicibacter sp. MYC098]MEB3033803.1 helix-turn-helix transcriptional regulator [Mycolicibacter sp. MYC340]
MSPTEWAGGEIIRARRIELDLTQAKVSQAAGLVMRQYQRYEKGEREPSLSTARAIAEALDLPLSELAGQTDLASATTTAAPANAVAEAIQHRRRRIGLTQLTVATTAGLDIEQYQRYESGKEELSLAVATAIAAALDMPLPELAGLVPRPVDLNGKWWASWQSAPGPTTNNIDTHSVAALHAGGRILLDSGWRGELRIWNNEILIGWYRPPVPVTRTRQGVFLWLPTHENYLIGRWNGVSPNNAVISGWCALARDEAESRQLADNLIGGKLQARPTLRLPGLSNWG